MRAGSFLTTTSVNNDDWTGFAAKLDGSGARLLYSTFVGGRFRSSANAVAVDGAGRAFIGGSTCSDDLPTTPGAFLGKAPGSDKTQACDGFLWRLNAAGSSLEYGTYVGGTREDAVTALALDTRGSTLYAAGYTESGDFPVTNPAFRHRGRADGFLLALDAESGRLLHSSRIGGLGEDRITCVRAGSDGTVYLGGVTGSAEWPNVRVQRLGAGGALDGFLIKLDPAAPHRASGLLIGGGGDDLLSAVDVDERGDIYLAGATASVDFPRLRRGKKGGTRPDGFVVKLDGAAFEAVRPAVKWAALLGGNGDDALLSLSAGMPGSVFVSGRSASTDFPATPNAYHRRLEARNDAILAQLRSSDGERQFATFVSGSQHTDASWYNDEATAVFAGAEGDVYVTGCTLSRRLPVTRGAFQQRPAGNAEPFVLRWRFPKP